MVDNFKSRDGSLQRLVALRGSVCDIPLLVWIMPYHPHGAPLIFIVPSNPMRIQPCHPHVDSTSGLIYLPYLSRWHVSKSNVLAAVCATVDAFDSLPPLYCHSQPPVQHFEDERRRLVSLLSQNASTVLSKRSADATRTLDSLNNVKRQYLSDVSSGEACHSQETRDKHPLLRFEMDRLRYAKKQLETKRNMLLQWRRQHPTPEANSTIDDITQPRHIAHSQMLHCSGLDYATTDTLDQLDEALCASLLPHETYIRHVRRLARDQFFARALANRLRQQQSAVSAFSPAAVRSTKELASCEDPLQRHPPPWST